MCPDRTEQGFRGRQNGGVEVLLLVLGMGATQANTIQSFDVFGSSVI